MGIKPHPHSRGDEHGRVTQHPPSSLPRKSAVRQIFIALALSAVACATPLAQSPAEQAYIDYQTALAIDDKCHFLRHFERQNTTDIDEELLRPLNLYIDYAEPGQDVDAIHAARALLVEQAGAKARNIACTDNQSAAPYILGLRDRIAHYLYANMMIGFESGRMSDEQRHAAQLYEAMIAPLYGDNWQGFVEHATRRAQHKIDAVRQQDNQSNIFESLWGPDFYEDYLYWDDEDDSDYDYDPLASTVFLMRWSSPHSRPPTILSSTSRSRRPVTASRPIMAKRAAM